VHVPRNPRSVGVRARGARYAAVQVRVESQSSDRGGKTGAFRRTRPPMWTRRKTRDRKASSCRDLACLLMSIGDQTLVRSRAGGYADLSPQGRGEPFRGQRIGDEGAASGATFHRGRHHLSDSRFERWSRFGSARPIHAGERSPGRPCLSRGSVVMATRTDRAIGHAGVWCDERVVMTAPAASDRASGPAARRDAVGRWSSEPEG